MLWQLWTKLVSISERDFKFLMVAIARAQFVEPNLLVPLPSSKNVARQVKPLCAYLTGPCWSTAAAALCPVPPHKFHLHIDVTTLAFQKRPSPQDVCRRGWSPREAQQIPEPKGHGKFHLLYHALGAWFFSKLGLSYFLGFKHKAAFLTVWGSEREVWQIGE